MINININHNLAREIDFSGGNKLTMYYVYELTLVYYSEAESQPLLEAIL